MSKSALSMLGTAFMNSGGSCRKYKWPEKVRLTNIDPTAQETTDTFTKENNIRLHISTAYLTFRNFLGLDMFFHLLIVERSFAINTSLRGETTMCFDDFVIWHSCSTFEGVYVLCETSVE